ncbi:hypothetical protein JB92DRAFT_2838891 [Gautieria morchelliformis]|nr:hypothetical protein JB92DRAFT_2838891 [Gautieria morchelliformis]
MSGMIIQTDRILALMSSQQVPISLNKGCRTSFHFVLNVDALHKRYGPFVQITPTQASCATPSAPSKIYSYGASSLPKSAFYCAFHVPSTRTSSLFTSFFPSREGTSQPSFFDPGTPNLFSTQDRGGHARKRRVLAHALSAPIVKGYEGWVRRCLVGLVKWLDVKCLGGLGKGLAVGAETPGRAAGSEGNLNNANAHCEVDGWVNGLGMAKLGSLEWDRHLEAIELKVNARGMDWARWDLRAC